MKIKLSQYSQIFMVTMSLLSFIGASKSSAMEGNKADSLSDGALVRSAAASLPSPIHKEDILLVHSTNYLPLNNVMIPGSVPIFPFLSKKGCLELSRKSPPVRPTIHWVPNGTVCSHDHPSTKEVLSRSGYKYIVIVPLKDVEDQVLGGTHQDMFTIGPVKLTAESILIIPEEDTTDTTGLLSRIHRYSPDQKIFSVAHEIIRSLNKPLIITPGALQNHFLTKETYEAVITNAPEEYAALKGWGDKNQTLELLAQKFDRDPSKLSIGPYLFLDEIEVNGQRVNAYNYFKPFFSHKGWTFGDFMITSKVGKLNKALADLYMQVRVVLLYLTTNDEQFRVYRSVAYREKKENVKLLFSGAKEDLKSLHPSIVTSLEGWRREINTWNKYALEPEMTNPGFLKIGSDEDKERLKKLVADIAATVTKDRLTRTGMEY